MDEFLDLYDDFVGPQFNSDLFAETWLNGRGKLPSECKGSKVMNVESVVLTAANVDFKSSHDHSKWAISTSNGNNGNWVCVGDINRAVSSPLLHLRGTPLFALSYIPYTSIINTCLVHCAHFMHFNLPGYSIQQRRWNALYEITKIVDTV